MQSRGYLYVSLSVATIPRECRTRKTETASNMAEEASASLPRESARECVLSLFLSRVAGKVLKHETLYRVLESQGWKIFQEDKS